MNTKQAQFLEESERILSPEDMRNQDEAIANIKASNKNTRIEKIQDIIDQKSAMKVDEMIIDLFSASIYNNIYNSLSDKNKAKLESMPMQKAIETCYKLTK